MKNNYNQTTTQMIHKLHVIKYSYIKALNMFIEKRLLNLISALH